MKKLFGISLICFILCVNYISCTNDSTLSDSSSGTSSSAPAGTSNGVPGGGAGNESGGTPTPAPTTEPANTRVFDFTNAKALAKLERVQTNTSAGSRAASGSNELGEFVKILEDGTMQNAVTVTAGNISEVKAIYKSPEANSKDIYILFQSNSYFYDSNNKSVQLGRFICVHEDGSIADILKIQAENNSYSSYLSINDDSVTFDSIGKVYFIAGSSIYQFNSKTNTITKMVAEVQGTSYSKIQIDKTGQWLFAYGSRYSPSSSYFLRAIPIENPNSPINVFYSSTNSIFTNKWVYDDNTETIYYIAQDGNNSGLFKATKAGGFANKTFIRSKTITGMEEFVPEDLFGSFRGYNNYSWYSSYITNGLFDANKVVAAILAVYNLSADNVDIRFDKYASESGALKVLALLTQGKKNAAAISALNNTLGMAALYSLSSNSYFAGSSSPQQLYSTYLHNFLEDILYVKNTDTLLNYPLVTMNGRYLSNNVMSFVMCNSYNNKYYCYEFKKTIPNVLEYFFSFCNVEGDKEFRLTAFQNDENYSALYSTLKNEEALQWIASDFDRLSLFNEAMGDLEKIQNYYTTYSSNVGISHNYNSFLDYCIKYNGYNGEERVALDKFLSFIAKTCYLTGTDTKAMIWNKEELFSVTYSPYSGDKLFSSDKGLFYEYSNITNNSSTTTDSPYYYLVQIAKPTGENTQELIKKITLPSGRVVKSQNSQDKIFMQYSLMQNGSELGYHHIYSVDLETGSVKNHFDNVPNRNGLEVISFSMAGDKLYYSAVRGATVENGIVNINTNEYNPLETQRKMVAVYALE